MKSFKDYLNETNAYRGKSTAGPMNSVGNDETTNTPELTGQNMIPPENVPPVGTPGPDDPYNGQWYPGWPGGLKKGWRYEVGPLPARGRWIGPGGAWYWINGQWQWWDDGTYPHEDDTANLPNQG